MKTHPDGRTQFVLPWVDDILMVGATGILAPTKSELARYFTITGGGPVQQYLGMTIERNRAAGTLKMTNPSLCEKIARTAFLGKHIYRSRPHNETRPSHP